MEFYTSVSRFGNTLLYRGYDSDDKRLEKRIKYKPQLFIHSKKEQTPYKSLYGDPVKAIDFESMAEMKEFVNTYRGVKDFEFFGTDKHIAAFIQRKFPNEIKFDKRIINVVNIDIETAIGDGFPEPESALQEIRAITVYSTREEKYRVWGLGKTFTSKPDVIHESCASERELLEKFITWWSDKFYAPDVITGWNSRFFDIPYLANRITRVIDENFAKRLSPWKMLDRSYVTINDRKQLEIDVKGIEHLDYMELFKKFGYTYGNQESYSLGHISNVVLGRSKIDYSDMGNLNDLFENDYQRFIEYNLMDVELVSSIDKKLGLIDIVFTIAYLAGVNYSDTLATTPVWDSIIYRRLMRQNVIVPYSNKNAAKVAYAGGYVKAPKTGMHDWVISYDVNSLYPNIMVQTNMSPETLMSDIDNKISIQCMIDARCKPSEAGVAVAANGAQFHTNSTGVIPAIIKEMYDARSSLKKKTLELKKQEQLNTQSDKSLLEQQIATLNNKQMALKILLNSLYGAIGNAYFRFFDLKIAEGITLTGQAIIQYAERIVNEHLNSFLKTDGIDRVIAIDTDSLYVCVNDIVKRFNPKDPIKFLDEFSKRSIEPALDKAFTVFAENHGAIETRIRMSREVIASKAIWVAKKRYILNVLDSEGVRLAEPKIKMMGIEAVKSSTPQVCRKEMKDIFPLIMNTNESTVQNKIADFKKKFCTMAPHEIAFPRSVNNVRSYENPSTIYVKGTPMHCRAALMYNHTLNKKQLDKKYRVINNGDKIKFIYLRATNPTRENVIAFPNNKLPKEFGVTEYIDFEMQFQKAYLDPIQIVLDAIGWNAEPTANLELFFG